MTFSVAWLPDAAEEYLELWLDAETREAVSSAGTKIDAALSIRPTDVGESRSGNIRILFELPLAVIYRVDFVERKVLVARIWYFHKRK
jgi:mRNA-degrading endonuclease RelE of RelBE toxin-antitoxin system